MAKILRLSFSQDIYTLDPQKSCDPFSSAAIFLLFKGLTRLEANHKIACDIADSIQISQDCKTYTFHLGRHFWSDGTPITAFDFEKSWKRALHPNFPIRSLDFFYQIKNAEKAKKKLLPLDAIGIYVKNPNILIVELENACPHFLELTCFCPLFPLPSHAKENAPEAICSGPFQLEKWSKGREVLLRKNIFCHSISPVTIDGIHIQIIPDEKEAFALFEKGGLDWIGDPISPLPLNHLPSLVQTRKIKPVAGVVSCYFNTLQFPFHNLNLRKAFSYAISREKVLNTLLLHNVFSASGPIPPILKQNTTSPFPDDAADYAKELFRAGLQELGIPASRLKITLTLETTDLHCRLAKLLQATWEKVFEIQIQLEPLPFKVLFERLPKREFQLAINRWLAQYTDPINILEKFESRDSQKNYTGWENFKYKAILKRYRKTALHDKRMELASQAEELLMQHMPIAPIYYHYHSYLQKPYLKNLAISPIGVVQFDRVSLDQEQSSLEDPLQTQVL